MTRAEARLEGLTHYHGNGCRVCGEDLRYVSNNRCVGCARAGKVPISVTLAAAQAKRAVRDAARARGDKKYQGHDCARNHGAMRFASSGECVDCSRLRDRKYYAIQKIGTVNADEVAGRFVDRPNSTTDITGWVSIIAPPTRAQLMSRRG